MANQPTLARAGDWSFKLHTGTPADLARYLEQREFTRKPIKNSSIEAERLERGPMHSRAIVIAFASGAVLVQGSAGPRQEAVTLLQTLLAPDAPAAAQLTLFGGTVEEDAHGGHWVAFGGAK